LGARDFCWAVERVAIETWSGLDFLLSTVIGLKSAANWACKSGGGKKQFAQLTAAII
jgi:hypothetical protein